MTLNSVNASNFPCLNAHPASPASAWRPSLPAAAWIAVALLWFAAAFNYLTRTTLTTMRATVVQDIPMTDAQFGLLTSAYLACYALACPFGGFFADRFSRRWVVLVSVLIWSSITLLTTQVNTAEHFLVMRALLGLSHGFYIPAAVSIIVDLHRGPTRAFATGLHMSGLVVGSIVGGLGGWLAEEQGWRYAYTAIGLPSLLYVAVLAFFLREPRREYLAADAPAQRPPSIRLADALRNLARTGPYVVFMASYTLQGAVSWVVIGWMPTVVSEQFHLGQGAAGFSTLAFFFIPQTIGLVAGGFWSDRWSAGNPLSRILLPAMAILLVGPVFLVTVWVHHMSLTLASLSLYGFAMGILGANVMPIICLVVDPRYRATAQGIVNACAAVGGGVSIYLVGALRDARVGVGLILSVTGLGIILCGFLLWLVGVIRKKSGDNTALG